jgi:hypothetical protein
LASCHCGTAGGKLLIVGGLVSESDCVQHT